MNNDPFDFHQASNKQKHPWGQTFTSIAAIIVTLIGAKVEGFNWIIYFAVPILICSFLLMVWDSPVIIWSQTKFKNIRDKYILSKAYSDYLEFLGRFKVVDDIVNEIQGMEWGNTKRRQHYFTQNQLSELERTLADNRHSDFSKVIFLNRALVTHLDVIDKYIQECDWLVIQREITYKYEHDKSRMLKLIHKYDSVKEEHNIFSSKINKICSNNTNIRQIYEHTFSFMPKDHNPNKD